MIIGFNREHLVCCLRPCMNRWQLQCRRLATWSTQWPSQLDPMPPSWDTRYDSACSLFYSCFTPPSSLIMTCFKSRRGGNVYYFMVLVIISCRCLRWQAISSRSSWQPLAPHRKFWTASSRWTCWTRQRLWQSQPCRCSIQPKKQAATLRCV